MAFTTSLYNHTAKKVLGGEITYASLKVILLGATASFTATDTTLDSVAGAVSGGHRPKEIYGNGWTEGGMSIASVASAITTTNDATLSGTDLRVRASGGSIGPAYACVIVDGTTPIEYIDFGGTLTAGDGTDILIPASAGLIVATY